MITNNNNNNNKKYYKTFKKNKGTRLQVYNGIARQTTGNLFKKNLIKNKHNRIVSRRKHLSMKVKKNNILYKKGYLRDNGDKKFGPKNMKSPRRPKHESKTLVDKLYNIFV